MTPAVVQLAEALAAVVREAVAAVPTGDALPPPALTVAQLATRYGRKPVTIRSWVEAGRFPGAFHVGRTWRVPVAAVQAFDTTSPSSVASPPPARSRKRVRRPLKGRQSR